MNVDYSTGEILGTASLGPLAAALAKAQVAFPAVMRSKTVRVKTKTGGEYTFAYALLDAVWTRCASRWPDNGLAIAQLLDREAVVTLLLHESAAYLRHGRRSRRCRRAGAGLGHHLPAPLRHTSP